MYELIYEIDDVKNFQIALNENKKIESISFVFLCQFLSYGQLYHERNIVNMLKKGKF